jgi:hypothetical protein
VNERYSIGFLFAICLLSTFFAGCSKKIISEVWPGYDQNIRLSPDEKGERRKEKGGAKSIRLDSKRQTT